MWNSNRYPTLTEEECDELVWKARKLKGQRLYMEAYGKLTKGKRGFPKLDAKGFREFVKKRGDARALDRKWTSGQFDIDADNETVLKLLALYFTGDDRFEKISPGYSLHKGIFLSGNTGVGKTILMQLCSTNPHVCYTQHDCQVVAEEYASKEGGPAVIDLYSRNGSVSNPDYTFGQEETGRFFDDLGQEDMAKHFGNERNVMAVIIENRYRAGLFKFTHITSNHTLDEIAALYGPRVQDRLKEMCNIIEYPPTAKSRR